MSSQLHVNKNRSREQREKTSAIAQMDKDTNIANSHGDKQHSKNDDVGGDNNDLNPSKTSSVSLHGSEAEKHQDGQADKQAGRKHR